MSRLLIAILFISSAACSSPSALVDGQPSAAAAARAMLEAIARNDRVRLEALALSEREFRDHVWPSLPAARPERNLPFAYVWGELRQKSRTALTQTLARHAGRKYELVALQFDGVTDYGPYRVHRRATLTVRDGAAITTVRLCGSVVEKDGGWKIFSYVTDG